MTSEILRRRDEAADFPEGVESVMAATVLAVPVRMLCTGWQYRQCLL
jgi:hypothetical protein